jgi:hypothetical protein
MQARARSGPAAAGDGDDDTGHGPCEAGRRWPGMETMVPGAGHAGRAGDGRGRG